jgi:hypothetical protein
MNRIPFHHIRTSKYQATENDYKRLWASRNLTCPSNAKEIRIFDFYGISDIILNLLRTHYYGKKVLLRMLSSKDHPEKSKRELI